MDGKIRVTNPNRFPVGVQLLNQTKIAIQGGSFRNLTQDDIEYIMSQCQYFQQGVLRIDEKAKELVDIHVEEADKANFLSDEELAKKLSGTVKALKEFVEPIENRVLADRLLQIAKGMDLPASRMKVLTDKFGEQDE